MSVALVTGANQGLGLAVVEQLSAVVDTVYLTGRDADRVARAAAVLPKNVVAERLDVTRPSDVTNLACRLADRHEQLDIVVSNAAARLSPQLSSADQVRGLVDTNNLGTTRMIRAFGPLLRPDGRFLVVASSFGSLRRLPNQLRDRFDARAVTLDDLDTVMLDYVDAVETGQAAVRGWPDWINVPSKVGQVAAARVYARSAAGRFVAAVCPGLVDTEASRPWFADMSAAQTPMQAAADVVALAVDAVEPRFAGELVQHRRVIPWR
ncbi:Rossmann-fold NAD(P)-binding domain-containing protein [Dactylosporangium cerinum]